MTRILLGVCLGMTVWMAGHAATQCVRFNPDDTCTTETATAETDGFVTCGNTKLHVISQCSADMTETPTSDLRDTLSLDADDTNNAHCWCRIVYPFVSRWVAFSKAFYTNCDGKCLKFCQGLLKNSVTARKALSSNIISE